MFEFVRYTFLVMLGLACMVTMFISLAVTGSILTQNGQAEVVLDQNIANWTLGLTAVLACLWLSSEFLLRVPLTIFYWFSDNRDQLAGYAVISAIFLVFVVS